MNHTVDRYSPAHTARQRKYTTAFVKVLTLTPILRFDGRNVSKPETACSAHRTGCIHGDRTSDRVLSTSVFSSNAISSAKSLNAASSCWLEIYCRNSSSCVFSFQPCASAISSNSRMLHIQSTD